MITISDIAEKYFESENSHIANILFAYPDNVMIHPCNRKNLFEEAKNSLSIEINQRHPTCFGMKIIWTTEIGEDEIICTYNSSR